MAEWQRGRGVYVAARFFGGPWTPPRRIARASDAAPPRFVSDGRTIALGVATGGTGSVRVARWSGGLVPAVDGPHDATRARDIRLVALPNHEIVTLFRRGRAILWSARGARGGWSHARLLFRRAVGASIATDAGGAVLATALHAGARGVAVVAALRSPRQPFGPASSTRLLGPRGSVTSVASAIRQDGRTGLVVDVRAPSGSRGLIALPAGARQTPVRVTAPGARVAGGGPAAVRLIPSAGMVAVWRQTGPGGLRLHAAREEDAGGGSWERPRPLTGPARRLGAPVMESAPDGRTILAYAVDGAILVRTLGRDAAGGWSAARRVSARGAACAAPTIAFDTAGTAIVAFACGGGRRLLMVAER